MLFFFGVWAARAGIVWFGDDWQYELYVNIGILALYGGLHTAFKSAPQERKRPGTRDLLLETKVGWLFYIFYVSIWFLQLWLDLSVNPRPLLSIILESKTHKFTQGLILNGNVLYFTREFFYCGACILLYVLIRRSLYLSAFIVWSTMLTVHLTTAVTRLSLLTIAAFPMIYYHREIRKLPRVATLLSAIGFVLCMGILNTWRSGGFENFAEVTAAPQAVDPGETMRDYFAAEMSPLVGLDYIMNLERTGQLTYEYGRNYLYAVVTIIPRAIWPDKPYYAFESRWTQYFGRESIGRGLAILTFTAWGEGIAQFGFFGVVLNLFIYGIITKFIYTRLEATPFGGFVAFHYVVFGATFLRAGVQAHWVVSCIFLGAVLSYSKILSIYERSRRRRLSDVRFARPSGCSSMIDLTAACHAVNPAFRVRSMPPVDRQNVGRSGN